MSESSPDISQEIAPFPILLELECGLTVFWQAKPEDTAQSVCSQLSTEFTTLFPQPSDGPTVTFVGLLTVRGALLPNSLPLSDIIPPSSLLRPVRRVLEVNLSSGTAIPNLIAVPHRFWSAGREGKQAPDTHGANAPFLQLNGVCTIERSCRQGSLDSGRVVCSSHCVPLARKPNTEICPICGEYRPASINELNQPTQHCTPQCTRVTSDGLRPQIVRSSGTFCYRCQRNKRRGGWNRKSVPFTNPFPHQCEYCRRPWVMLLSGYVPTAPGSKKYVKKLLCKGCKSEFAAEAVSTKPLGM